MKFLFDLGGVFFDWDPNHFYKNVFENIEEREFFLAEVCNDQWNVQQDAGRSIGFAIVGNDKKEAVTKAIKNLNKFFIYPPKKKIYNSKNIIFLK